MAGNESGNHFYALRQITRIGPAFFKVYNLRLYRRQIKTTTTPFPNISYMWKGRVQASGCHWITLKKNPYNWNYILYSLQPWLTLSLYFPFKAPSRGNFRFACKEVVCIALYFCNVWWLHTLFPKLKMAYYSFYEARARATIRLPDVNIARARKAFVSNTKGNENTFEPFIRKLTVSESFRRF